MKILIAHERAYEYAAGIKEELPDVEIVAARNKNEIPTVIEDIDVILAWRVPKEILRKATNVRWLASTGAGVDHLIVPELASHAVITKAPPIFGQAIAEYVLGYILYVFLRIGDVISNKQQKLWAVPKRVSLSGKLLGILGMGTIGTEVARAARFFGMRVWGLRRTSRPAADAERSFGKEQLDSFLPHLDFLVVTLPLTRETRNLIGPDELSLLKRTCWIVNVARGRILDEDSLARALGEGRLGGYISDVFATEPLPETSPLWTLSNVIITPHYGALTPPEQFVPFFADNMRRFMRGEPLRFQIDRDRGY